MEKKLPGVFANKIEKKLDTNKNVFYSSKREEIKEIDGDEQFIRNIPSLDGKNVKQKIYAIFHAPNYIYKADVDIKLKDKTVTKKVIGYNSRDLIAIDNTVISISEIEDIKFHE